MKFHLIAAATLLVGSTAVLAQDADEREVDQAEATVAGTAQNEVEQPVEEEDRGEEVVCRTERVTGSLTRRRRTCMTRNEWAGIEARTRDELNRMGRNAAGGAACRMDQQGGC